jgi:outer membrane protein assembly factor BamB
VPLGQPIQAGPAGMFTAYGGAINAILLGTRDGSGTNAFHALDPATLNPLPGWPYTGETTPANQIGMINSQAAVDYATDRVYFTSYQHTAGVSDSVWCLDLVTASRCSLWPVRGSAVAGRLGDIAASPTLRGGRLYVSPVSGEIDALSASDGSLLWTASFKPLDGQIKLFMLPDHQSSDLYFSTNSTVWSIRDDGSAASEKWRNASIPSPSQPVFFAGTGRVYVGGGDGSLYILKASDGTNLFAPIPVGDGLSAVGPPTVDQAGGFVYVGTDAGVVYAVVIP